MYNAKDQNIGENSQVVNDIERRVRLALDYVRPYLRIDGGSVELVRIDMDARVAEVCLLGACRTCSMISMTLRAGIERAVLREAPELRRIEAVSRPDLVAPYEIKMN